MMNFRQFLKPALRWLVAILAWLPAGAQVFQAEFRYGETVVSDYSSLFNSTGRDKARRDSISHAGFLQWHFISDTLVQARITTTFRRGTMAVDSLPAALTFLLYLDKFRRPVLVSPLLDPNGLPAGIVNWITELNFKMPAGGVAVEKKPDGDFSTMYSVRDNQGTSTLVKGMPRFLRKNGGRQAIVFSRYEHVSKYDPSTGNLLSLEFTEEKKQVLGRKVLACIQRELVLTPFALTNKDALTILPLKEFAPPVKLFQEISASERRDRLAVSLLGNRNFADLEKLLATIGTMTGEQQFRLKSMLRSLLVLDSTSAVEFTRVLATWKPGSPAFEAVENAVIESRTSYGEAYIKQQLEEHFNDYERLKSLLLKITVADAITPGSAGSLVALLDDAGDRDTRNLVSLALSNYALTVRESDPGEYAYLTSRLLNYYRHEITDTLQYLYVVGNAGIAGETPRLLDMLRSFPQLEPEIIFALRHIYSPAADSLVEHYLLHHPKGKKDFATLLVERKVSGEFTRRVQATILDADTNGDSTQVQALQFLLDRAWEDEVDLAPLLAHSFNVEAYRREIADFRKQISFCDALRD